MNIQTEHIEKHQARLTVQIDAERLNSAKQKAAKRVAQKVNIPGFRKGKAPYNILVNYVGEGYILEEALEMLGQDLYKEALDASGVKPYAAGALEDFKADPAPTFIYTVPLQPTTTLGDYRNLRVPFTAPTVEDKQVDDSLHEMQQEYALVEDSTRPVQLGDRITADMHSFFVDTPAEGNPEEYSESQALEIADVHDHDAEPYMHEHDAVINLINDPIAPGFAEALVGHEAGETVKFILTLPETEEFGEVGGRKVVFHVVVKEIKNVTLPALNDDLAARATANEERPLTLLELRVRVRENLEKAALERANRDYAQTVLDELVKTSTISYPDMLIEDQIDLQLRQVDNILRQQGLNLETYQRITGNDDQAMRDTQRENAITAIERNLVLREVMLAENVEVGEQVVDAEIDAMLQRFGGDGADLRRILNTPDMRASIRNDKLQQAVYDRLVAIAKGEIVKQAE